MASFAAVLAGDVPNGAANLDGVELIEDLVAAALNARWRLFHLDGTVIDTKEAFLDGWAQAVDFPDWAGRNWDALNDLLTDEDILDPVGAEPAGYVVVHDHPEVLEAADARSAKVAAEVMADAARYWRTEHIRFVILHRQSPAL